MVDGRYFCVKIIINIADLLLFIQKKPWRFGICVDLINETLMA